MAAVYGGRRQSRFTEQDLMASDYTPSNSVYAREEDNEVDEGDDDDGTYEDHQDSVLRMLLRAVNGCVHSAACIILVAIMGQFLQRTQGTWYKRHR
jgi:hypothetical protein